MPTTLTITTDVGTFTRRTNRTYSHIVVVGPQRAEYLEARRRQDVASFEQQVEAYSRGVSTDGSALRPEWLADGTVAKWITDLTAAAAALREVRHTQDVGTWGVAAWCGRQDLAFARAGAEDLNWHREVRVYVVATGERISTHVNQVIAPESVVAAWETSRQVRRRRYGRRRAFIPVT